MSNSDKMNISERLAQRIKESELGALIDEDDLTSICKDAIQKAFFKERRTKDGYNEKIQAPLIVEMAQAQFKTEVQKTLTTLVDELVGTPDFKALILDSFVKMLPAAVNDAATGMIKQAALNTDCQISVLRSKLAQRLGIYDL